MQCDTEFFFAQYKFSKNLDSVIGQKIDPFDSYFWQYDTEVFQNELDFPCESKVGHSWIPKDHLADFTI